MRHEKVRIAGVFAWTVLGLVQVVCGEDAIRARAALAPIGRRSATSLSPFVAETIRTLWANRKQYLSSNLNIGLQNSNTETLYNTQWYTNNLLKYAARTGNLSFLDELAELYLEALPYLELKDEYIRLGGTTISLDPPAWMWVDGNGQEIFLYSSQFLYVLADAINAMLDVGTSDRTDNMNALITNYAPIVLTDHYLRWIAGPPVFPPCWWPECHPGGVLYNHEERLAILRDRGCSTAFAYCSFVTDIDMWIIAGVVEMLAAHSKDPILVPLTPTERQSLLDYVGVGSDLLESRLTTSTLVDFKGLPVTGLNFDAGTLIDHPGHAYAGYTGLTFPTPDDAQQAEGVGWDIGHAHRFVHVFDTLFKSRSVTGQSFPSAGVITGLANQLAYGAFNKNLQYPLAAIFMDGTNGWYRVGYQGPGFGYAPFDYSMAMVTGPYGFWWRHNQDVGALTDALLKMIEAIYTRDVSGNGHDIQRVGSQWTSSGKYNGAEQFDGVDDKLECGWSHDWKSAQGAIEFWMKPGTLGVWQDLVKIFKDSYYNYLVISLSSTNKIFVGIEDEDEHKVLIYSSTVIGVDPPWHHVLVTQEGGEVKVYIDGVRDGGADVGTDTSYWTDHLLPVPRADLGFGHGTPNYFHGLLDEVRMYNRSIDADEAAQHYANNFANNSGLVAYWDFDAEPDHAMSDFVLEHFGGRHFVDYVRTAPSALFTKTDSLALLNFLPSLATPTAPDPATDPTPADAAVDVSQHAHLSWFAGAGATSFDVYFGTDDPPPFLGNQAEGVFDPRPQKYLSVYYWRIDAVNEFGTTTGDYWSFTTTAAPGDCDRDGRISRLDYGGFAVCHTGPVADLGGPNCGCFDLDGDQDVDVVDFGLFQRQFNGS